MTENPIKLCSINSIRSCVIDISKIFSANQFLITIKNNIRFKLAFKWFDCQLIRFLFSFFRVLIFLNRNCRHNRNRPTHQCNPIRRGFLNVHIICHTHLDTGWVNTYEEYYQQCKFFFFKQGHPLWYTNLIRNSQWVTNNKIFLTLSYNRIDNMTDNLIVTLNELIIVVIDGRHTHTDKVLYTSQYSIWKNQLYSDEFIQSRFRMTLLSQ